MADNAFQKSAQIPIVSLHDMNANATGANAVNSSIVRLLLLSWYLLAVPDREICSADDRKFFKLTNLHK